MGPEVKGVVNEVGGATEDGVGVVGDCKVGYWDVVRMAWLTWQEYLPFPGPFNVHTKSNLD